MKKNKVYILIAILATVLIFGVAATCTQCGGLTPATTATTSTTTGTGTSKETTSAATTAPATTAAATTAAATTSETTAAATTGNRNPVIADIIIPGGILYLNHQYDISASASDPDGDSLTYAWTVSGGSINNAAANPMKWTPASAGDYTIQVKVTDGKGGEATKLRTVSVSPLLIKSMDVPKVTAEGGYVSWDGTPINVGGCLFAGDDDTNKTIDGFISFDITALTNATIETASLTFHVKNKYGDPSFFSGICVADMYWGTVSISGGTPHLSGTAIQNISSTTDGNFTVDNAALKNALQTAINAGRPRFQIGVGPLGATSDNNNDWDGIEWEQSGITLNITYTQ